MTPTFPEGDHAIGSPFSGTANDTIGLFCFFVTGIELKLLPLQDPNHLPVNEIPPCLTYSFCFPPKGDKCLNKGLDVSEFFRKGKFKSTLAINHLYEVWGLPGS